MVQVQAMQVLSGPLEQLEQPEEAKLNLAVTLAQVEAKRGR